MIVRRHLLTGLAFGWIAAATGQRAAAAERTGFTDAKFAAAQADRRPIIIDVTAPWCPVCKAQAPHVAATIAEPAFTQAVLFEVDFDSQKAVLQRFGVRQQSTLIAFKGKEERGRATGITDPAEIAGLLRKAL
jgi:thioredoxin-like negative regulator of GroEL